MSDYKSILGAFSVLLAIIGYGTYFRQIFSGKIKPHAFSWLVWGVTTAIIFLAQFVKNGGAGAWATAAISIACFAIFFAAYFKRQRKFLKLDWIFLVAALVSLVLWRATKDPTLSVILLTATDVAASFPTVMKAYRVPFEESFTLFSINSLRSLISLLALSSYSLTTALYPVKLIVFNALIASVILIRRGKVEVAQS